VFDPSHDRFDDIEIRYPKLVGRHGLSACG
jgi:hypothetical protein